MHTHIYKYIYFKFFYSFVYLFIAFSEPWYTLWPQSLASVRSIHGPGGMLSPTVKHWPQWEGNSLNFNHAAEQMSCKCWVRLAYADFRKGSLWTTLTVPAQLSSLDPSMHLAHLWSSLKRSNNTAGDLGSRLKSVFSGAQNKYSILDSCPEVASRMLSPLGQTRCLRSIKAIWVIRHNHLQICHTQTYS